MPLGRRALLAGAAGMAAGALPAMQVRAQAASAVAPGALAPPRSAGLAGWPMRDAAASGWDMARLARADEVARQLGSDATLVVQREAIVHSFGDIARPLPLYSVRKSILGLLVGMHRGKGPGRIDLDATLADLGIDDEDALSDAEKQATVRQLLMARSGVYHRAAYETARMARERPARGSHAPGSHWYYNNWDFNALATVFRQRVGRDLFEALEADLAVPLRFQDFRRDAHTRWHHERASRHDAYLIELSARDLARIGLLMLQDGRWDDRNLVDAAWVAESTQPHSEVPGGWQAYGYLWWVPRRAWPFWKRRDGDVFAAMGNFGQFLFVDRRRQLVIVHRTDGPRWLRKDIDAESVSPWLNHVIAAAPA